MTALVLAVRAVLFAVLAPVALGAWLVTYLRRGYPLTLRDLKLSMATDFRRVFSVAVHTEYAGRGRVLGVSVFGGAGYVWSAARIVGSTLYFRVATSTVPSERWVVRLAGGLGLDGKSLGFENVNDVRLF